MRVPWLLLLAACNPSEPPPSGAYTCDGAALRSIELDFGVADPPTSVTLTESSEAWNIEGQGFGQPVTLFLDEGIADFDVVGRQVEAADWEGGDTLDPVTPQGSFRLSTEGGRVVVETFETKDAQVLIGGWMEVWEVQDPFDDDRYWATYEEQQDFFCVANDLAT